MAKFILPLFLLSYIFLYGSENFNSSSDNLNEKVKLYNNKLLLKPEYTSLSQKTDYSPKNININKQLTQPQRKLAESTFYTQILMIGSVGVIYLLPESVSKWDKNELKEKSLGKRWEHNVKKGPVWDKDSFVVNYVGHSFTGAWYYTAARNYGISMEGSFLYSAFLSTFMWEYGYESVAEIPSWQDLISTPILGLFFGEYFYSLEKKIDKNEGKVLNSKVLGNISYFVLNPIGRISNSLSDTFDLHVTVKFETYQHIHSIKQQEIYIYQARPIIAEEQDFGIVVNIEF